MKATPTTATTAAAPLKSPNAVKFIAAFLLSTTLLLLFLYHLPSFPSTTSTAASPPVVSPPARKKIIRPTVPVYKKMGVVDENGVMTENIEIGEFDPNDPLLEELRNLVHNWTATRGNGTVGVSGVSGVSVKYEKYRVCGESKREYIPCLDSVEEIRRLNISGSVEKFERHCPVDGKGLDCLVPAPVGYRKTLPWPLSRDQVWFNNVPHTRLVEDKGGQNWIYRKGDKFVFPGGGTQFIHGADQYLNQISQMVPEIAFGENTHVTLDIGCGVASFGAYLFQRNVTTLSVAPKDVHENQIQFALERGVPAMVAVFGTRRLLYPSQAFDLIHCSRCRINWTQKDGILLLEVNRMLRAGGYFVWAAQPVYKHKQNLQEEWNEMQNLTSRICWELIKKGGYIAVWRKPLSNSCYLNREAAVQPPLCDPDDDPDNVWYVGLKACISRLPKIGHEANVTTWPSRLHELPNRLHTIKMDAEISRKELLTAEYKYWYEVVDSYVNAFHWKKLNLRNVMDMRAGFGGFAAALYDLQIDCWVMNVVPVNEFNTLPAIYDRGLIGAMHDWCEPFDTYPRTYDLLHAFSLFSAEKKRKKCNFSTIMLEMDRILRPGGRVYIRDTVSVIFELNEIARAMDWTALVNDVGEGPHSSWRILISKKRL